MATTFQTATKNAGSKQTTINVDRDGKPFGQLWTFTNKGEVHGWHAKTLDGAYAYFDESPNKKDNLSTATLWMICEAA